MPIASDRRERGNLIEKGLISFIRDRHVVSLLAMTRSPVTLGQTKYYSYRSESAGLARAARNAWKLTVKRAIPRAKAPARKKVPQPVWMR